MTAQHPQKIDRHGFITRTFNRTYILPLDVDPLLVKATLSHDGILSIEAPKKNVDLKEVVNTVKIEVEKSSLAEEVTAEKPEDSSL